MAVPTHFYKVVLGEVAGGSEVAVGAWVLPNSAIAPDIPLTAFTVPLSALEEVAGEAGQAQRCSRRGSVRPPRGMRQLPVLPVPVPDGHAPPVRLQASASSLPT